MLSRACCSSGVLPIRPFTALLLRCLLLVTLCLEGSASVWAASAMAVDAVGQARGTTDAPASAHARMSSRDSLADAGGRDCVPGARVAASGADDGAARPPAGGDSHAGSECNAGGCDCACLFQLATVEHSVPFLAQHALIAHHVAHRHHHVPSSAPTRVFRPPIG